MKIKDLLIEMNDITHKDAIVKTAIKKYVKTGADEFSDVDIYNGAAVEDTVDGDYWVQAWVFVRHEEVFKPSNK